MKKIVISIIIMSCIATSSFADVDTNKSAPAPSMVTMPNPSDALKIRFVDPYKVIQGLEQWKDEGMRIQKELQTRNDVIEEKKTLYGKKANELQSMGSTAKQSVKDAKREDLLTLQNDIQIKTQSLQEYAERVSQEAQMSVFKEIEAATHEVALEMQLDLVLAGGALYVSEKIDVSQVVVEKMNIKYQAQKRRRAQAEQKTASDAVKTVDQKTADMARIAKP